MTAPIKRKIARFGWQPDHPDGRDKLIEWELVAPTTITKMDLSTDPAMPPIWDQLQIGSCTAHGTGRCYAFARAKHLALPPTTPSRLFIYYFERYIEGSTATDSGAQIRDGFKVLNTMGVPPETEWPYGDGSAFAIKPNAATVADALNHEVTKYTRLAYGCPSLYHIKNALAAGFPIAFGFTVYSSFMGDTVAKTGIMPMPKSSESVEGGHCVAAVGFDDSKRLLKCANSWNTTWGDQGYFYMPYDYLQVKYCSDFWQAQVAV